MFRKILLATDLTDLSVPALSEALDLAREERAHMVILHVHDPPHDAASHWGGALFADEVQPARAAFTHELEVARDHLARHVKQHLGARTAPQMELIVKAGRAAETIVGTAHERGSDLVIVGTRGREGTIGSVAERVVRTARRPVLVVPAHGDVTPR